MKSSRKIIILCGCAVLIASAARLGAKSSLMLDRHGKIVESQGICALKPRHQQRWTPVSDGMQLNPGDWLRTDVRGANAMRLRMKHGQELIIGPGSLIEIIESEFIQLIRGEIEVSLPHLKTRIRLRLADGELKNVTGPKSVLRVREGKLTELSTDPDWLQSFKGAVTTESMGSLLANVDGRDVPLTIGYHKVSIDIRDQIARTVIEESFVNHTRSTLEGVFYFPLPQDASISGFAMWIGDELVEADVVEKQRAREIYETILRERRDPGLLEWSGGNIFKARVFPIVGHSEKRIKITYTQVLPMKGRGYRYSYALQSEMLKQTPLRELAIDLKLHSSMPLVGVSCPTHAVRVESTEHSVQLEFDAQEYTPSRDFEVNIDVDRGGNEVMMIPHLRGEDGYFLLLLSAPDDTGQWERSLVADGPPLDLIIVADTSASMDAGQRAAQDQFLATLLGSLGEADRFRLVAIDVGCNWFNDGSPSAASEKSISDARDYLAGRSSLGWTDLEGAFGEVLKRAEKGTQIIYIGDGIGTTGDADPVAIAAALKRLYTGKGSVHTIATGSSYESGIMKALASLGGGSFRFLEGDHASQRAAMTLLSEILQPGIRDLSITFEGLRVARVYPEDLPNLAAGTQQILLGRYLSGGKNQSGKVTVSGTRGEKQVRFSSPVTLKDAEKGNSFIPRLWARMHLDELLAQGRSQEIKSEIIGLSEEYHIMTPYTSFLILESDEDRERFKVTRRFQIRDGERFFAEGRDAAVYELRQKQIQLAGQWRQDLRRGMLRELLDMGRSEIFQLQSFNAPGASQVMAWNGGEAGFRRSSQGQKYSWLFGRSMVSGDRNGRRYDTSSDLMDSDMGGGGGGRDVYFEEDEETAGEDLGDMFNDEPLAEMEERMANNYEFHAMRATSPARPLEPSARQKKADRSQMFFRHEADARLSGFAGGGRSIQELSSRRATPSHNWLDQVFPMISVPPRSTPHPNWPAEFLALSDSLLRLDRLKALKGGLEIGLEHRRLDPSSGELKNLTKFEVHVSPGAWVSQYTSEGQQTLIHWADGKTRGVFAPVFDLGRQRILTDDERSIRATRLAGYQNDGSLNSIASAYPTYKPRLETLKGDRVLLELVHPTSPDYRQELEINTKRNVLLAWRHYSKGELSSETRYKEFKHVAGSWWATRIVIRDAEGRQTVGISVSLREVKAAGFEKTWSRLVPDQHEAIVLQEPLPTLAEARQALHDQEQSFEDQLVRISHHLQLGQWDDVRDIWDEASRSIAERPGEKWITDAVLSNSRRKSEAATRLMERAVDVTGGGWIDEYYVATFIFGRASSLVQANERLALLDLIKPVYKRQPKRLKQMKEWQVLRAPLLDQVGRSDEALEIWSALAKKHARDTSLQMQYFNARVRRGELDEALAWIQSLLAKQDHWTQPERRNLRHQVAYQLRDRARAEVWLSFLRETLEDGPVSQDVYDQYLVALLRTHDVDATRKAMRKWIDDGVKKSNEADDVTRMRLQAAVRLALGQGGYAHGYRHHYDGRWTSELARVVRAVYRSTRHHQIAGQIMGHHQFRNSDEGRKLSLELAIELEKSMATLNAEQVVRVTSWLIQDNPQLPEGAWASISGQMQQRWIVDTNVAARIMMGQSLVNLLRSHGEDGRLLEFLHLQHQEGPATYKRNYARLLFDALLARPWTTEIEDQLFDLFAGLSVQTNPVSRTAELLPVLYQLVDALERGRYVAGLKSVSEKENLSGTAYKALRRKLRVESREGIQKRLSREVKTVEDALKPWLEIEGLYLASKLRQDSDVIVEACWQLMDAGLELVNDEADVRIKVLEQHLQDRCLATLAFVAVREKENQDFSDPLLRHLELNIKKLENSAYRKYQQYRLLVALDRPGELETALRGWIRPEEADDTWRVALGYLMAELGRVDEAVQLFEAIESTGELLAEELRVLADWYMVVGRKDAHHDAVIRSLMAEEEYRLQQRLQPIIQPWYNQREGVPDALDPETFNIFTALFRKSQNPSRHVSQLQSFYKYTRDFRLLECLAEGVLGHSPQQVYPLMTRLERLFGDIHDEATVDGVVKHLKVVRQRAANITDERALDILELQVERRAAELQNQPKAHADAAFAAMQRAFLGEWGEGESRLMANLLAALGRINISTLQYEQLRQLRALHSLDDLPEQDHLAIAISLADTLYGYEKHDGAIDVLEATLVEFRQAHAGLLGPTANDVFAKLVLYLAQTRKFVRAEKLVLKEIELAGNDNQRNWMKQRLLEVYTATIKNRAGVSVGSGQALYAVERDLFVQDFASRDASHRGQLMNLLSTFLRESHDAGLALEGIRDLAFVDFGAFLEAETNPHNYHRYAGILAEALHDSVSAGLALEFVIRLLEKDPEWVRMSHQAGWNQHAYRIGRWRAESKAQATLMARLLKLVEAELRADLKRRSHRSRALYWRHNHFWSEKKAAFRSVADVVWAEDRPSGAAARYISEYLAIGLDEYDRAIELLLEAVKAGTLDDGGKVALVDYLHHRERYAEAIPFSEHLVQANPDVIDHRVRLMRGYFKTGQARKLSKALTEADRHFHENDIWHETVIATLAKSCLDNKLLKASIAYYDEVIALHKRSHRNRGVGNGTLSTYYTWLSRAHIGLQQTKQAVEAASGAIVSWGKNESSRRSALNSLQQVLAQAPNLDGYVLELDQQVADSGLENPIIRQALGWVYLQKRKLDRAATQLRLAVESQPNDRRTHELLLKVYERSGDSEGAIQQLREWVKFSPREIALYEDLGKRLAKRGYEQESERALTSMVEMLVNESESHAKLAEIRQGQGRWRDAMHHWKQVIRIRSLEPTGYLNLARIQVHEKQWREARETCEALLGQSWPERFRNVRHKTEQLLRQIPAGVEVTP